MQRMIQKQTQKFGEILHSEENYPKIYFCKWLMKVCYANILKSLYLPVNHTEQCLHLYRVYFIAEDH